MTATPMTLDDRDIAAALGTPVAGLHLRPGTLRDQLGPGTTLLAFLRQSG